ncbi:MAG: hypothetical protein H0U31_04625 [Chloroflexia bacterium]|nr:hypothetical protein [Chloroflexia bacterium]
MKRLFTIVAVSLLFSLVAPVAAQEATPGASESLLAGLGYAELLIRADGADVELPDQVTAGRTLIVYENVGQDSTHPFMLRLPDDLAVDEALADLGPEAMEPPAWFLDAEFPGFVGETLPGQTSFAVVDLVAGPHLVLHDSAVLLDVVGTDDASVTAEDPSADATVSLFEMGYEFPDTIDAGRQVWEVTNTGQEPHELLLVSSTVPVTAEQIIALFSSESEDENATPVGGGPSFANIDPVGGLGWLSAGATGWTEVDLQPGHYAAICFVFDPETGMPHLMLGMADVFTVGDD